ncbi:hypothetical protein OROHE_016213 [Orobanche hederae]
MKVVEQGMGGDKLALHSNSNNYHPYPPPMATYEDVLGSRDLFMDILKKFHASMGIKFMIPIVGGRDLDLDLHRLFLEVTSRGGIAKDIGGTDTTSATLEWTMAELLRHPSALQKLQKELPGIVKCKHDITGHDLEKNAIFESCCKRNSIFTSSDPISSPRSTRSR